MRTYHHILKVARTIADLEASPNAETSHISEAIGNRRLDRSQHISFLETSLKTLRVQANWIGLNTPI
ncbi:MAG: hypothetical protein K1563_20875 [Candidatus Thiodiazotropha sp. (ex. Lucinisca nassula)]|nr:hypothetical protein [Candidatus Thiodiazotropha sp. (ex. Lucinisca nassula)]